MPLKFGKKPALRTMKSMRSALALARHFDPLGSPPPESNPYYKAVEAVCDADWGMLGNDSVGDCTMADGGHALMLRTANASAIVRPTEADVLAAYSACTGYDPRQTDASGDNPTDQGANEVDVCKFMEQTGLLGHRSVAYGTLDPYNLDHLRWAIQIFGCVRMGIRVPSNMEDQFDAGQPFDKTAGAGLTGDGHDICYVHYDAQHLWCVTWGGLRPLTVAWHNWCVDEAHVELYPDWIRTQGTAPNNLNMAALEADLQEVQLS